MALTPPPFVAAVVDALTLRISRSWQVFIQSLYDLSLKTSSYIENVGNQNLIVWHDFELNPWDRGTSARPSGWIPGIVNTNYSDITHSRATDAPTVAEADIYSIYCYDLSCDGAQTTSLTSKSAWTRTIIEGMDFRQIAQRPFTLSFWHKSNTVGVYSICFSNSALGRIYVGEYTQRTADTWEKAEVTVPASPSAGTWLYAREEVGLNIDFMWLAGTTYQTAPNVWTTYAQTDPAGSPNQVNLLASTSNYMRLTLIKLEPGSYATAWHVYPLPDLLDRQSRYIDITKTDSNVNQTIANGICLTTTTALIHIPFRNTKCLNLNVLMRNSSTLASAPTLFRLRTSDGTWGSGTQGIALSSFVVTWNTTDMLTLTVTVGSADLVPGEPCVLETIANANATLVTICTLYGLHYTQ